MAEPLYTWQSTEKLKQQAAPTVQPATATSPFADTPLKPASSGSPASFGGSPAPSTQGFGGTPAGFGAAGNQTPSQPFAPTPKPTSFAEALKDNPFAQPLTTQASQVISQNLSGQAQPSFADELARSNFIKAQDEALRKVSEQSALSGRAATGQLPGDAAQFLYKTALPARGQFEAGLAAGAEQRAQERQQSALGAFSNLAGMAQQASQFEQAQAQNKELALADLNLREKTLAENVSQFKSAQDFQRWAIERGYTAEEAARAWQATENEKSRASQEKVAFAGLSQQDRQLAQQALQFASELDFRKSSLAAQMDEATRQRIWQAVENEKARTSTEKIAMAELSVREKQLAQEAGQFKDELAFKKYATDRGFTDAEAQRAWQATQNQLEITSREKIAFAGLDVQKQQLAQEAMQFTTEQDFKKWALERNLDAQTQQQVWQATQNEKDRQLRAGEGELDRTLQKYIADQGFQIDAKKFAESVRQFDAQQDFQKWATQAGLDADAQKLVWQAQQNDLQRKHDLGMALTDRETNVLLEGIKEKAATSMANLEHVLNLDTLDKQEAHDLLLKNMDQSFTERMTREGQTWEQTMEGIKQDYAKELAKMGYDQQTALQASEQLFQAKQQERELQQARYLSEVQLAQQNTQFMADLQQKYQFKQEDLSFAREQLYTESAQWLDEFGLKKEQSDALVASEKFQTLGSEVSTLIAMAGDNPDIMHFAAETFYKGLGNMTGPDGQPLMSAEQIQAGLDAMKTGAQGSAQDTLISQLPDIGTTTRELAAWKDERGTGEVSLGNGMTGQVTGIQTVNGKPVINLDIGGTRMNYDPEKNKYFLATPDGANPANAWYDTPDQAFSDLGINTKLNNSGFMGGIRSALISSLKKAGKTDAEIQAILKSLEAK